MLQMRPFPLSSSNLPSGTHGESGLIRELRDKIAAMEKEMVPIFAGTAIIKKKGELALEFEKHAREELVKVTNSLQCE